MVESLWKIVRRLLIKLVVYLSYDSTNPLLGTSLREKENFRTHENLSERLTTALFNND